jgi:hypothetical protein
MPSRKIATGPNLSTMPFEYRWHCVADVVPTFAEGKALNFPKKCELPKS